MPPKQSEAAIEQEARITRIESAVESTAASLKVLASHVDTIATKVSAQGKTNWTVLIAAGSLVMAIVIPMVTAGFFFTKLSTESLIAPMIAEQGISKTERAENRRSGEKNSDAIARLEAAEARASMTSVEMESQIRNANQVRNMMISELEARVADIHQEVRKQPMSRLSYYPDPSLPKPGK